MDQTVGTWILGIVLVLIQCALTTIVGLIIKKKWDARDKEHKELEDLREQQTSIWREETLRGYERLNS